MQKSDARLAIVLKYLNSLANTIFRPNVFTYQSSFMNSIQSDFSGMDAANDPRFLGLLFDRIDIPIVVWMAGVLPGNLVQVLKRPILNKLNFPTDFNIAGSIFRIHNQQGDFGVGHHVLAFLPLLGCIDASACSIIVTPDQAGLGLAIWHHGSQDTMNWLRE
jgi:hypothetical protein